MYDDVLGVMNDSAVLPIPFLILVVYGSPGESQPVHNTGRCGGVNFQ